MQVGDASHLGIDNTWQRGRVMHATRGEVMHCTGNRESRGDALRLKIERRDNALH
jgi:hypothetical protein